MSGLGFILALAAILLCGILLSRHIFGPLDRAAKGRRHPLKLVSLDFFCLFVLMWVAIALGQSWPEYRWTKTGWLITVCGLFAFGLLWLVQVRNLSLAGVRNGWHRTICLVLVIPLGIASVVLVPLLSGWILIVIFNLQGGGVVPTLWLRMGNVSAELHRMLMQGILVDFGLLALVFVLSEFTQHVAAKAGSENAPREPAPGEEDTGDKKLIETPNSLDTEEDTVTKTSAEAPKSPDTNQLISRKIFPLP